MENVIKTISYISIIVLLFLIWYEFINLFDFLFPYIINNDIKYYWNINIYNIFENNVYFQLLLWVIFILICIYLIIFFNKFYDPNENWKYKYSWKVREYLITPFSVILSLFGIFLVIFFISYISWAIAILFYELFKIEFLLYNNIIILLCLIGLIILSFNLNKKYYNIIYNNSKYILFTIIVLIISLFILKPNTITLNENNICYWKICYLYSDINTIKMDYSSYNIEIVLNPFNLIIPISISKSDMNKEEYCDWWDDDFIGRGFCEEIHKPLLNINDRISYILDENNNRNEITISKKIFEKKNYENTFNYIITERQINNDWDYLLYYGDSEWDFIVKHLYRKTNIVPIIVNKL